MSPRQPNDAPTPAEVPHLLGESPFPSGDNSTSRWSQQTLFDPNVSQPFQPEPEGILDFRKHPSHSFLSQRDRSKVTSGEPHAHIVDRFQAPQFNHRRILLRTRTPYQLSPPPFFNSPEIFHKGRPFYVDAHGQKHLDESRQFLWEDPTSPETDNGYGRPAKVVPDSALQTSHHTRNDGHQTKSDCSIRMELHLESETPLRRDGATKAVASASAVERTPQPSQHRSWDSRISMQTRLSVTNTKYCLIIRQQPEKCRGSGFGGEKTDRRPIDPSVIVQLCTVLPNGDLEASLSALGPVEAFVAHAVLLSADGSEDRSLVLVPRVSIPLDAINSGALTIAAHEPNASHQYRGRPDDENRRVIDTNGTTESSFMDSVDDRPSLESAGPEDATRNANAVPPSTLRLSSSKAIDGLYSNTLTEIDLISIPTDAEPGPAPPKHPLRLGSQDFEYDTHVRAANEEYELASNGARGYDVRDVATAACFRKVDFDGDKGDHSLDDMVERGGTTATGPCGKYRYRSLPLDSEVDENQQHYLHQDRHGWNHVAIGRGAITRVVDPSIEETIDSLNDNRGLTRGLQRDCVGSSGGSAEGTGREGMNLDEGHQTNKPLFGSSQHAEADKVLTKAATPSDTADSFAAGAVSVDGHSSGTPGSGGVETSGANPVDRQNNGGGPEVMTDQSADRSSIEASGDSPASGASKGSDTRAVGGAPRGCPEHSTRKRRCWRCSNESGSDCSSNCAVSNASGQLRAAPTPRKGIGPPSRSSNDSKGQTRRHSLSEHKFRLGTHQNANNHFHSTRRDWPRRRSWDASTSTEPRTILPKAGGDRKVVPMTIGPWSLAAAHYQAARLFIAIIAQNDDYPNRC
ncbi:hypothetical protein DFJ73DRAFT_40482 [Zopfochytrium polystomum]|nr:hypothetical protein DFJ73DRAFT_40482 [Zopfochytrium polystomum]